MTKENKQFDEELEEFITFVRSKSKQAFYNYNIAVAPEIALEWYKNKHRSSLERIREKISKLNHSDLLALERFGGDGQIGFIDIKDINKIIDQELGGEK